MEKYKYFETILTNLNILRYIIYSKVELGLYDTNKQVEGFFKDILNIVYNWDLKNKNEEVKNFPGVDLSSTSKKIGIQITSQNDHAKVQKTLTLVDKHCSGELDRVIVFILTKKSNHSKKFVSSIAFDKKKDIIDLDDLLTVIEKKDTPDMKLIAEYVEREIPYYIGRITSEGDILRHRVDYSSIRPKNCKKLLVLTKDPKHLIKFRQEAEKFFDKLNSISHRQRIGVFVFVTKCDIHLHLRVSTWFDVLRDSFRFDRYEARSAATAIENANLFYNDEDEFDSSFKVYKEDFWLNIKAIIKSESVLHDLIVNMNFSLLDE